MLILTIETCTDTSTLGLVEDDKALVEAAFPSQRTLAQRLFSRIDWMLADAGKARPDISAIAVSMGPGSFTGVRIGMTAAKNLAHWLCIPLVGIPTLEAIAYPFRELDGVLLAPTINARRQQAYSAVYRGVDGRLQRETDDLMLSTEPFIGTLATHRQGNEHVLIIGQTAGMPAEFFRGIDGAAVIRGLVTPYALAALARERLDRGDNDDPMTLTPIYLRAPTDRGA